MRFLNRFASVLSWILRRDRAESLLDDEMRSFVEMSAADKIRDGVPAAEARRLALIEIGGIEPVKERVRGGRHGALLDDVGRDARYALRLFARQRTFAVVIVGTLALGIGANTAIFSIVDSLLFRTLPIQDPERLAQLVALPPSGQRSWTYPIWEEIQRHADRFDGVFAWSRFDAQFNLSQGGETRYANGVWASAASFDVLGVKPALGRLFLRADDGRGGGPEGPVAVISHAFWQRQFAGARDVIGRTLTLERVPVTIVGVTPPGFFGLTVGRSFDVAVPFGIEPLIRGASESRLNRRTSWWLSVMVRLKRGQSLDEATTILRTLQSGLREATLPPPHPGDTMDDYLTEPLTLVSAAAGQSGLRDQVHTPVARDPGGGRARAAHCLRQHRQSPARSRHCSRPRVERAARARRVAGTSGAAAADREPAARSHGGGGRIDGRAMGQRASWSLSSPRILSISICRSTGACSPSLRLLRSSRRSSSALRRRCARPAARRSTR